MFLEGRPRVAGQRGAEGKGERGRVQLTNTIHIFSDKTCKKNVKNITEHKNSNYMGLALPNSSSRESVHVHVVLNL